MGCLLGEATGQAKPFGYTPVDQIKHFDDTVPAPYGAGKFTLSARTGAQIP
jgi:hypothetical protein